ncbi:MAG TPA: hypothetical protein VH081_10295 [Solirubrobacteraceae bacterium]|jgi:hypothetical protein|nr:hypothetical protein [Solirubrobacteraceae bacterium]
MTDEQPNTDDRQASAASRDAPTAVEPAEPAEPLYQPEGDWLDDAEELPPRPRRRLLTPIPLTLLAILAIACGFIAGVLVEKGQGGSSSAGGGAGAFAARLAAAGGKSGASSGSTSGSGLSAAGAGGAASGGSGAAGGSAGATAGASGRGASGGATIGQVAYVSKGTLYVTTLEGNTVKVTAAPGATVTKSVKTSADGIHPGETVVVTGAADANGAISAQSIRAGSASGSLTGAAGLFGGSGSRSGGASGSSGSASSSSSSEQPLFGKG